MQMTSSFTKSLYGIIIATMLCGMTGCYKIVATCHCQLSGMNTVNVNGAECIADRSQQGIDDAMAAATVAAQTACTNQNGALDSMSCSFVEQADASCAK